MSDEFLGYYSHRSNKRREVPPRKEKRRGGEQNSSKRRERKKRTRMQMDLDGRRGKNFLARGVNVLWVVITALVFLLGAVLMGYDAYQEHLKNSMAEYALKQTQEQGGGAGSSAAGAAPAVEGGPAASGSEDPFLKGLAGMPDAAPPAPAVAPMPEPVAQDPPSAPVADGGSKPDFTAWRVGRPTPLEKLIEPAGDKEAVQMLALALEALRNGYLDQATVLLQEAREKDTAVQGVDLAEAWLHLSKEELGPAKALAERIARERPEELAAHRILCDCLRLQGARGEWRRAVDAALAAHPGDPYLLAHRGLALREEGKVLEGLYWADQLPCKESPLFDTQRRLALIQAKMAADEASGWQWRYSDEYLDMYWAFTAAAEALVRQDTVAGLDFLRAAVRLSKNRLEYGLLLHDPVFDPMRERAEMKVLFTFSAIPPAVAGNPSTAPLP